MRELRFREVSNLPERQTVSTSDSVIPETARSPRCPPGRGPQGLQGIQALLSLLSALTGSGCVWGVGVESALGPALWLAIEVGHSTGARGLLPLGQGMELRLASPGTCTPLSGCQHLPPMHRCDVWGILTPDRGSWHAIVGSI